MNLVVVTAGLTQPSSSRLLADRLAAAVGRRLAAAAGPQPAEAAAPRVIELRDLAVDIANNVVTGFPNTRLREVVEAVTEADGLIVVTPIFSGSYSGLFKSFFDVIDNTALGGKPVLIAATGGTARHSLALEHAMRPLFAYLRAVVVPTAVYAASEDWGGGQDAFTDGLGERVERAAVELADLLLHRAPASRADDEVVPFEQQLAALRPPA
ncbi:FMN reductase [Nonomuraea sp. K274]|uniref:FMN reductase n=1 Tax=Nonomuraea cypriaca TaxID=1187855 RepID=A0A931AFV6_9ACTN|nr:FMN reductase [Nonomuraea cypriaca]MBF8190299.1 FMN reductase [Nonomuraea cypriaca]